LNHQKELEAKQLIFDMSSKWREEYAAKMIDMIKVVTSLSAVMLSIMAGLLSAAGGGNQVPLLLQLVLVLLLFSLLAGVAALHSHAEIHQIQIDKAHELTKTLDSFVAVKEKMRFSSVQPRLLYRHADYVSIICFCLSLILITWFAIGPV